MVPAELAVALGGRHWVLGVEGLGAWGNFDPQVSLLVVCVAKCCRLVDTWVLSGGCVGFGGSVSAVGAWCVLWILLCGSGLWLCCGGGRSPVGVVGMAWWARGVVLGSAGRNGLAGRHVEAQPRRSSRNSLQYSMIRDMIDGEASTTYGFENRCGTTIKRLPAVAEGHHAQRDNVKTVV